MEDDRLCTVALLSTSDTDLLTARSSGAEYRLGNPARLALDELPGLLAGADVVVVRLLGGEQAWREGLGWLRGQERPVVVVGGEQAPDAALMALSTVPAGIADPGARVPGARRHGQPAGAAEVPERHGAARRGRVRGRRGRPRRGASASRTTTGRGR